MGDDYISPLATYCEEKAEPKRTRTDVRPLNQPSALPLSQRGSGTNRGFLQRDFSLPLPCFATEGRVYRSSCVEQEVTKCSSVDKILCCRILPVPLHVSKDEGKHWRSVSEIIIFSKYFS